MKQSTCQPVESTSLQDRMERTHSKLTIDIGWGRKLRKKPEHEREKDLLTNLLTLARRKTPNYCK
jgi:hypothetical protein